jgi:hypothetical protein
VWITEAWRIFWDERDQPFKGGQMATQRNYLILRNQTQSSAVLGCAAGHQGKSQAIDFQCYIFAPLKGWMKET